MRTDKTILIGVIMLIIPILGLAQNSTNSPYARNGYGILGDNASISQRGMGGLGFGLRNPQMINPANPASFSCVDSMTFMFDMGIMGQVALIEDAGLAGGSKKDRRLNGNLEYMAMQFPVAKRLGVGAGLEPVSHVGYKYMDTTNLKGENDVASAVSSGGGGLSRVYGVVSYDFSDRLSLGVKMSYMFGDIVREILITNNVSGSNSSLFSTTHRLSGFLYDFGLQYHQPIGSYKTVTVGAVYSPKMRPATTISRYEIDNNSSTSVVTERYGWVTKDSVCELSESFGLGFTYNQLGKLTIGADALYQRWSKVQYESLTNVFSDRLKLSIGGELIPNRTSNKPLGRIRYRAGLSYSSSYLKIKDNTYDEYGASLGFGISMPDKRSFLNVAFEYSVIPETNYINEQYFRVSLSYTFNEPWFFKRKVQ